MEGDSAMQHEKLLEVIRRAVRTEICPTCFKRGPLEDGTNSTTPSPQIARRCEPTCNIMLNLRPLQKLAQQSLHDDDLSLEDLILQNICQKCESDTTSGDYCRDRTTRECPLSRYAFDVMNILEKVIKASQHVSS